VLLSPEQSDPDTSRARLYDDCYRAYMRLYPATRESMHELSGLAGRDPSATPE